VVGGVSEALVSQAGEEEAKGGGGGEEEAVAPAPMIDGFLQCYESSAEEEGGGDSNPPPRECVSKTQRGSAAASACHVPFGAGVEGEGGAVTHVGPSAGPRRAGAKSGGGGGGRARPPCKFFAKGRCHKGVRCTFSHIARGGAEVAGEGGVMGAGGDGGGGGGAGGGSDIPGGGHASNSKGKGVNTTKGYGVCVRARVRARVCGWGGTMLACPWVWGRCLSYAHASERGMEREEESAL